MGKIYSMCPFCGKRLQLTYTRGKKTWKKEGYCEHCDEGWGAETRTLYSCKASFDELLQKVRKGEWPYGGKNCKV